MSEVDLRYMIKDAEVCLLAASKIILSDPNNSRYMFRAFYELHPSLEFSLKHLYVLAGMDYPNKHNINEILRHMPGRIVSEEWFRDVYYNLDILKHIEKFSRYNPKDDTHMTMEELDNLFDVVQNIFLHCYNIKEIPVHENDTYYYVNKLAHEVLCFDITDELAKSLHEQYKDNKKHLKRVLHSYVKK